MQTENGKMSDTSNMAAEKGIAESTSENMTPTPSLQQTSENCGTTAAAPSTHGKNGGCCGGCGG